MRGDDVTITLRTLADDVTRAYAVFNGIKKEMRKARSEGGFDYYRVTITCTDEPVSYYFAIYDEDDKVCYNKLGWAENNQSEYNFSFIPGFTVPDWRRVRWSTRYSWTGFITATPPTTWRTTNITISTATAIK